MEFPDKNYSLFRNGCCVGSKYLNIPGDQKDSCFTKHKMHNKGDIFKTEMLLDCQWANFNFALLVIHLCCHLAKI